MTWLSLRRRGWILCFLLAAGFLLWANGQRRERIQYVGAIGRDAADTSGSSDRRHLIVPEHLTPSYAWVAQTETMLERGGWRVRQVENENAPFGRPEHAASPYRWWLALIAAADRQWSDHSWGAAIETAALWADPLLHLLLLAAAGGFVARHFGATAAVVITLGLALLFPVAAGFLPGVPDDFGLMLALAPSSLLPLVVGYQCSHAAREVKRGKERRWFMLAGVAAGLGLWIDVTLQVPLLIGVAVGALLAALPGRATGDADPGAEKPFNEWRCWGLAAGGTVLIGYLIEYFPADLGEWELRAVHPLYGLSCVGLGEVLARLTHWIRRPAAVRKPAEYLTLVLGLLATAALPVALWRTGNIGFLNADLLSFRLTKQIEGVMAPNLVEWLVRDGFSATLLATLLPVLLAGGIGALALHRALPLADRRTLALTLGPLLIALGLACFHLRWWQLFGALLLVAACVAIAALPRSRWPLSVRWTWGAIGAACLALGLGQLIPTRTTAAGNLLSLPEVEALVERDLAHALARRVGPDRPANVLAPPGVSATLNFYGGLPGLASLSWENKDGLSVALRIVISSSREEAHALVLSRGVTHIIIPSWDPFFESYTRAASVQANELFLQSLRRWVVPMWLRPVPYQMPTIGGFENQSVTIFEVVDEQDPPAAMSRVTEYFIEMGEMDAARAAGEALRRYPADFSALVARAQLEAALTDANAFRATLQSMLQRLDARGDRLLPWDRRVSLAIVLARGQQLDRARAQAERCLEHLNEERLRSLTPYSLLHFQILLRAVERPIADPALRALALDLLPPELRRQL